MRLVIELKISADLWFIVGPHDRGVYSIGKHCGYWNIWNSSMLLKVKHEEL